MVQTILQLNQMEWAPARLPHAALVLVCMQAEFREGPLRLNGIDAAVDEARALLDRFRAAGAPVIHVARAGDTGDFFDRLTPGGKILTELAASGRSCTRNANAQSIRFYKPRAASTIPRIR